MKGSTFNSRLAGILGRSIALALAGCHAWAAPDASPAPAASAAAASAASAAAAAPDSVLQLLHERGLLPRPVALDTALQPPALVRQVQDAASDLVMQAMHFLGVPYRRGGDNAHEGFDCSGFTRHVFENTLGLVLPRRSEQQASADGLLPVARGELEPGDLVFFNTLRRAFSHVGIYIGEGRFIHSPRAGGEVRVEDMRHAYWAKRFNGARRAAAPVSNPHKP